MGPLSMVNTYKIRRKLKFLILKANIIWSLHTILIFDILTRLLKGPQIKPIVIIIRRSSKIINRATVKKMSNHSIHRIDRLTIYSIAKRAK
jgi:hypothetical protein